MQHLVIGFWGCYFGTTVLMLAVSALAYQRKIRAISIKAAGSVMASAIFVMAYLGWISLESAEYNARLLAGVACVVSSFLAYLLLAMLGSLRQRNVKRAAIGTLALLSAGTTSIGFLLPASQAQALAVTTAAVLALAGLVLSLRNASRGDRQGWMVVVGVFSMTIAICGLGWIAADRSAVPWQVHVVSAVAASTHVVAMGFALWVRYAYLAELHYVMALGPSYDPVTRMRSHGETSSMVTEVFKQYRSDPAPLGLIVVSIANLGALEKLYGLAAANHALFVCAGRLKRVVPERVDMGRLGGNSFLLLVRNCKDSEALVMLARNVQACLSRPLTVNTSLAGGSLEKNEMRWQAEAGTGVVRVYRSDARASSALALSHGLSRTAWSYPSRVAWYDEGSGEIVGMPVLLA